MATVTLSDKYQVVIPKEVRKGLNLKPGQKLRITKSKAGKITVSAESALDKYVGSMKGAWGKDSDAYLRELRDEWEEHQQQLDDLRK